MNRLVSLSAFFLVFTFSGTALAVHAEFVRNYAEWERTGNQGFLETAYQLFMDEEDEDKVAALQEWDISKIVEIVETGVQDKNDFEIAHLARLLGELDNNKLNQVLLALWESEFECLVKEGSLKMLVLFLPESKVDFLGLLRRYVDDDGSEEARSFATCAPKKIQIVFEAELQKAAKVELEEENRRKRLCACTRSDDESSIEGN